MQFYANLHTHTLHSDGKYTPAQLAEIAKKEGYHALAVTDHDTATAYPELKAACDELGLDCIFGVEFTSPCPSLKSVSGGDVGFHITAYHFDPTYPPMQEYLRQMALRETDQTQILFERGLAEGLLSGITWDEVLEYNKGIAWLCNEHVFLTLKAKGLMVDTDYNWFFDHVYGPRRSEVPPSYPFKTAQEIISLVHEAGGIAIVAHPHDQLQHIDALIDMGIDGLEVWHPDLTEEEKLEAYRIGLEKNLYMSGGSDHSGLCGGMYETFEVPETCGYFLEPCSVGTTKEYYEEIKYRKKTR